MAAAAAALFMKRCSSDADVTRLKRPAGLCCSVGPGKVEHMFSPCVDNNSQSLKYVSATFQTDRRGSSAGSLDSEVLA